MKYVVLITVLAGCGALGPARTDAGATGGGTGGTGGGIATGGSSGGGPGGGGGSGGGGSTTDGWTFSTMALNGAPTSAGPIVGLVEAQNGDVFAMSQSGTLYRSTGGSRFEALFTLTGLYALDFDGTADGPMFAISTVYFWRCLSNCAEAASWERIPGTGSGFGFTALCVASSTDVLVLGEQGSFNDGFYSTWNGALLSGRNTLDADGPNACWKNVNGELIIAADQAVVRYTPSDSSFTTETAPAKSWRGGGSGGGRDWLSGTGPTIAEHSDGGTTWNAVYAPVGVASLVTEIIGISPTLAFGFASTSNDQHGFRFDGTRWQVMTPDLPGEMTEVNASLRTTSGVIYVGGRDSDFNPVIIRGVAQ